MQIHVAKVSQAKLFESFRVMPKYSKAPHACINPSPQKTRPERITRSQSLEINADRAIIKPKPTLTREIPPHLARPTVEVAMIKPIPVKP
jgi:hypothetical protein